MTQGLRIDRHETPNRTTTMTNAEYLAKMDELAAQFPMADMMEPSIRRKVEDGTIKGGELTMARHAMPFSLARSNRPLFIEGDKAIKAVWTEWTANM